MWQQIWFLVNLVFVALLIFYMFAHRTVAIRRLEGRAEPLRKAILTRNIAGILTAVAFVCMAASFLINMRVNG
ncbi:hypothetical protein [Paenibacillus methanolicus]|uniref:Uncharacterized protein n=1 Tax=Paenibacillus methanolicus TaxID=582686 RepID=A0A5S5CFG2_9BACL|nr:hypothetical protein [Paenibacillus methanolicus]TYP77899.1 hypothetical protein BCM02_102466 [Paenibacillus methanolicus]